MKGKKQVIYAILNIINGKSYIGSAINFDRRKKTHLRLLNKNSHHSIKLQNAYNKYGVDSFLFKPTIIPPKIVAKALDTPGTIERTWNIPIAK